MSPEDRIRRAVQRRLTPEQYAQKKHTKPYLYTLGTGDDALTFIGAEHSTDPSHEQFAVIGNKMFEQKPDMLLVEGVQAIDGMASTEKFIKGLTEHEAITRGGESIYAVKRAIECGIPWGCPEPEDTDLYSYLIQSYYSRTEVFAWHLLRFLPQFLRRDEQLNFRGYVAPFLAQFKQATGWSHFDYTFENAYTAATQMLGHEINEHNLDIAYSYTDPVPWSHRWDQQTIFNEISRIASAYRDDYLVTTVATEMLAGKKVMVVYGASHAVMLEPVFRDLRQG